MQEITTQKVAKIVQTAFSRLEINDSNDCQLVIIRMATDGVYLNGGFQTEMRKSYLVHDKCEVVWDLNHRLESGIKIIKKKNNWLTTFSCLSNKIFKAVKTPKWTKRMKQFKTDMKMDTLVFLMPQKFHPVRISYVFFSKLGVVET